MHPTAVVYSTRIRGIWQRWVLWQDEIGNKEWRAA